MQDLPDTPTLLDALARFLLEQVAPAVDAKGLKYRVKVAAHLAATVAREVRLEGANDGAELQRLRALFEVDGPLPPDDEARRGEIGRLEDRLADALRDGRLGGREAEFARGHLMQTLRERLAVVQPGFDTRLDVESAP